MELLIAYRVRLWTERLLCRYLEGLTIVARAGRYYGAPFKGSKGVTQGNPLSPTIFNMVLDTVICHWEMAAAREGFTRREWT